MPFLESQAAYSKHNVPLFPVRIGADGSKQPMIRNYQRIGGAASAKLTKQFGGAPAFGFLCGERSKITVLDVDTDDERVLADALTRHGKSPVIIRTARRRYQAWYRWSGEQRRIRPHAEKPIDILGGGVVVAPNSCAEHGQYEIIQGSLDDMDNLPRLTDLEPEASSEIASMGASSGRNNWLFRQLGREAHCCDDFDALLDCARTLNSQFAVSLDDGEVLRAAKSVWKMTTDGRNRFGQYGAWLSLNDVERLVADPHLCALLSWLKAHNQPGRNFLVADGLKEKFGWPRRQLSKARQRAVDEGWIVQISAPRRGRAANYGWGPASSGSNQKGSKKINNVYVEDILPKLVGHSRRSNGGAS
jgi:Bifunctional DNA primase/polymerase, N-terminal/Primase C terminal 1 (PriCT-1)